MTMSTPTSGIAPEFTEEQLALGEMSRDLFDKLATPAVLRAIIDGADTDAASRWRQISEVGLAGIGVVPEHGGMDGDTRDLQLVLEAAGRSALPDLVSATIAVAAPVIGAHAPTEVAGDWLPRITSGNMRMALALDPDGFVSGLDVADGVLTTRGDALIAVVVEDLDVTALRPEDATRSVSLIRMADDAGATVGGADAIAEAVDRAIHASAAELLGVCQRLLDDTVEYAKLRKQFDTPIGAFQAIQHTLADMFVAVEASTSIVRAAARSIAVGNAEQRAHAVRIAKVAVCEAWARVDRDALQLHGGIGFTWEHDLHLWLKRGAALAAQHGGAREHRAWLSANAVPN